MKTKTLLVLFSLLICSVATAKPKAKPTAQTPLSAATPAQLKVFEALYQRNDDATMRLDFDFLDSLKTANYVHRSLDGKVYTRAQEIKLAREMKPHIVKVNWTTTKVENLGFRGNRAYVIVSGAVEFSVRAPDKQVHRLRTMGRSTDVWISTKRGWLIESETTTADRFFVDGREVVRR